MDKFAAKKSVEENILYTVNEESGTGGYIVSKVKRGKNTGMLDAEAEIFKTYGDEIGSSTRLMTAESIFRVFPMELSVENIKRINRALTGRISPEQKQALIEERNGLVSKKFKEGLTAKEERHLTYVRWQLDRIDDAEHGETLDVFDQITKDHEGFASQLKKLLGQLAGVKVTGKEKKKGKYR